MVCLIFLQIAMGEHSSQPCAGWPYEADEEPMRIYTNEMVEEIRDDDGVPISRSDEPVPGNTVPMDKDKVRRDAEKFNDRRARHFPVNPKGEITPDPAVGRRGPDKTQIDRRKRAARAVVNKDLEFYEGVGKTRVMSGYSSSRGSVPDTFSKYRRT